MRALVLGGAGFIGSHVADRLTEQGFDTTVFDLRESPYLQPSQKMVIGSINDLEAVKKAVQDHDYVLNFAGIADLNDARHDPIAATNANVLGNLNLLEAMKAHMPRRYVFASTYYVYSESGSIYRVTKQSCELYIEEYARQFGIPFTILRFGSIYGPRASKANAIYRFLREAVEFGRVTRKGQANDQREYLNVLDASAATCEILADDTFKNQHVILAGQQLIEINDLFAMINEMMGGKISITYAPGELNDHGHYSITPYSFKPKVASRYTPNRHHDLGQGLLQMMHEIHEEVFGKGDDDSTTSSSA